MLATTDSVANASTKIDATGIFMLFRLLMLSQPDSLIRACFEGMGVKTNSRGEDLQSVADEKILYCEKINGKIS